MDFAHVKITHTHVGSPGNDNAVITRVKKTELIYRDRPSPKPSDKDENCHKTTYEHAAEAGRTERVAIIDPGVVTRLCATIVLNGAHSQADLDTVRDLAGGALGSDAGRNDEIRVRTFAFQMPTAAPLPAPPPAAPALPPWLPLVALAPAVALGAVLALRQRRSLPAPALQRAPSTTLQGIADLEHDLRGSAATTAATRVDTPRPFEELARQRPEKVAALLRDTWLADKER